MLNKLNQDIILIKSGIAASLLFAAMNFFIPFLWKDYSVFSQTVSELSAIDAPTRNIWLFFGIFNSLLMIMFGIGVIKTARKNHNLKITGYFLLIYSLLGIYWPPMHQREILAANGGTVTDTLHLIWAAITVLLMFFTISFGASALGFKFRVYSLITIVLLLLFGFLTSIDAPKVEADLPTPWIGIWERINIGVFLIWVSVLAFKLLKTRKVY